METGKIRIPTVNIWCYLSMIPVRYVEICVMNAQFSRDALRLTEEDQPEAHSSD